MRAFVVTLNKSFKSQGKNARSKERRNLNKTRSETVYYITKHLCCERLSILSVSLRQIEQQQWVHRTPYHCLSIIGTLYA